MSQYQQDLINFGSYPLRQIDRPYSLSDLWEISVYNVYQKLRHENRSKNRVMGLIYGYYLGELIQLSVTPRDKWKEFVREYQIPNEGYYYTGAIRIYKLFEDNLSQIYQTLYMTFKAIARMKNNAYHDLLNYNSELAEVINGITEL